MNNIISPEHLAKFSVFDGISWTEVIGSTPIEDWSHLVALINHTKISLYVNGTLEGTTQLSEPIFVSGNKIQLTTAGVMETDSDLVIGAYISTTRGETTLSDHFSGSIDEVLIYKEILSESQIQNIYSEFLDQLQLESEIITVPVILQNITSTLTYSEKSNGINVRISQNTDDAEEKKDGIMDLDDKSDLDIAKYQIGLRFQNIEIPSGSIITKAYIQFTAENDKEKDSAGVDIFAEDVDNAKTFSKTKFDITSRERTNASVDWFIPTWEKEGDASLVQRTSDISTLVQEVVNRDGWSKGNSLAFMLITNNNGDRDALTYDGDPLRGALLHIEFSSAQTTKEITLSESLQFSDSLRINFSNTMCRVCPRNLS